MAEKGREVRAADFSLVNLESFRTDFVNSQRSETRVTNQASYLYSDYSNRRYKYLIQYTITKYVISSGDCEERGQRRRRQKRAEKCTVLTIY